MRLVPTLSDVETGHEFLRAGGGMLFASSYVFCLQVPVPERRRDGRPGEKQGTGVGKKKKGGGKSRKDQFSSYPSTHSTWRLRVPKNRTIAKIDTSSTLASHRS